MAITRLTYHEIVQAIRVPERATAHRLRKLAHPATPPATLDLPHLSTDFMNEAPPPTGSSLDIRHGLAADELAKPSFR
jgi:hypothetical protein